MNRRELLRVLGGGAAAGAASLILPNRDIVLPPPESLLSEPETIFIGVNPANVRRALGPVMVRAKALDPKPGGPAYPLKHRGRYVAPEMEGFFHFEFGVVQADDFSTLVEFFRTGQPVTLHFEATV